MMATEPEVVAPFGAASCGQIRASLTAESTTRFITVLSHHAPTDSLVCSLDIKSNGGALSTLAVNLA